MRFLPSGLELFAQMGSCLSVGAEPMFELVHPLLAVAKMEVGAPTMTALGIEDESGADAVVEEGAVIADAVLHRHEAVIGGSNDKRSRRLFRHLLLAAVEEDIVLRGMVAKEVDAAAHVGERLIHRDDRIEKYLEIWSLLWAVPSSGGGGG